MTIRDSFAASALALALVACGGGGSSPTPTSGGGVVAAPAPAPTPTPTPTPTPPPSPTYPSFSELTGEQTLDTVCGGRELVRIDNGSIFTDIERSIITPFGADIPLVSDRDEPNYTFWSQADGLTAFNVSFDQSDRDLNRVSSEIYRRELPGTGGLEAFLRFAPPSVNSQPLIYAQYASLRYLTDDNIFVDLRCALGVPTLLTDTPSSVIEYSASGPFEQIGAFIRAEIRENPGLFTGGVSAAILPAVARFDPESGEITLNFTVSAQTSDTSDDVTEIATFSASAVFDGSETNFSGVILDEPGSEVGEFNGWFFGPQGAELAISVNIETSFANGDELFVTGVAFLR
ncbi:hypothetical protein [uncultured Erythrobacter sp.]|uniref:hypothetical protein n=1 Tax=uncultured Erythrobacter sp. TaxID=263913 RepID=UPI00262B1F33|nr:hypothetical protein [uncultured Erythrobacter sp.]